MGGTALQSCDNCGRMRWATDRFCAECGEAFKQQRTVELEEFDADALAPSSNVQVLDEAAQHLPRSFLIVGGGLLAIFVLLGLFSSPAPDPDATAAADTDASTIDLAPMAGFGGSPTVTPVPQFDDVVGDLTAASGLPITPVPARPGPDATPAPTTTPDPAASIAATEALTNTDGAQSALLDHLLDARLDLGAQWIATLTDDHRPRAVNVETGEDVVLERTNQFGAPVFFAPDGAYSIGVSGEGSTRSSWFSFQPWSGDETRGTRLVPGDFIGSYSDPERGTVVVSAAGDGAPTGQAIDLDTEATTRFEQPNGSRHDPDWARFTHSSFGDLDHMAASAGGVVWIWTWDSGWEASDSVGDVVLTGPDERITRDCRAAFDSCDVTLTWAADAVSLGAVPISADWRVATFDESDGAGRPSRFALSGDLLLSGESAGGATIISIWDRESDAWSTMEVGIDVEQVFWMEFSPNGRYLFISSSTGTSVLDADSGDLVLLNERAAGAINGLLPSPLVFLDELER